MEPSIDQETYEKWESEKRWSWIERENFQGTFDEAGNDADYQFHLADLEDDARNLGPGIRGEWWDLR